MTPAPTDAGPAAPQPELPQRDSAELDGLAREFTLAAMATAYPSEEWVEVLTALRAELEAHPGLGPMLGRLAQGADALRGDYLACFDLGSPRALLYETGYGRMRGLAKGSDLADVAGFYNAFGFDLAAEPGVEMPDHLAVELEFYALMLHKQRLLADDAEGRSIVADARRKFLADHLGAFAPAVAAQGGIADHPVYGPLLTWAAALVQAECTRESVRTGPLERAPTDDGGDGLECGGCVAIPGLEKTRGSRLPPAQG